MIFLSRFPPHNDSLAETLSPIVRIPFRRIRFMPAEALDISWFHRFQEGDSAAAGQLWETYFSKLCELVRRGMNGAQRGGWDEEDVALSALKSVCMRAKAGEYSRFDDPTNLWPLLAAIAKNKWVDRIRRDNRLKRGGADHLQAVPLDEVLNSQQSHEFIVELNDELERVLKKLADSEDPRLHQIALWRLEGDANAAIAERLGVSLRTVERKLQLIAKLWEREIEVA